MNDPEIQSVEIDDARLTFRLSDRRTVGAPLSFYPTLLHATPAEHAHYVIYPFSVHWPNLDAECLFRSARELPLYAIKATHREPIIREDPPDTP